MKVFKGLAVVAAVIICVCDLPSVSGQLPDLLANGHAASLTGMLPNLQYNVRYPLNALLADTGTFTFMPSCSSAQVTNMSLVNTWTDLVVATNSALPAVSNLLWDSTAHPRLTPEYTGVYRCITGDGRRSQFSYFLVVVAAPTITSQPSTFTAVYDGSNNITCNATGILPLSATWTTRLALPDADFATSSSHSPPGQGLQWVKSTLTFTGNLTVSAPLPEMFLATCQVWLIDNFNCSTAAEMARITTQCNAVKGTIASRNTTVTVVRVCENLDPTKFILPANYSTTPPSNVPISCRQGFKQSGVTPINQVTCLESGLWSPPIPECVDASGCGGNLGGPDVLVFTSIMALLIL